MALRPIPFVLNVQTLIQHGGKLVWYMAVPVEKGADDLDKVNQILVEDGTILIWRLSVQRNEAGQMVVVDRKKQILSARHGFHDIREAEIPIFETIADEAA